jgi:hypothetical protein
LLGGIESNHGSTAVDGRIGLESSTQLHRSFVEMKAFVLGVPVTGNLDDW